MGGLGGGGWEDAFGGRRIDRLIISVGRAIATVESRPIVVRGEEVRVGSVAVVERRG